jgi:rare lipoprotein A (peptidoglycan hydrolase)
MRSPRVRPALAQRELALAAIAVLAGVVVLAVSVGRSGDGKASSLPQPVQWYKALAAPYTPSAKKGTACGQAVNAHTLGVAHPTLPCGVKIFLDYDGKRVLTQVIDKGPAVPGREFDVTRALADKIGLQGVDQLQWAYAR